MLCEWDIFLKWIVEWICNNDLNLSIPSPVWFVWSSVCYRGHWSVYISLLSRANLLSWFLFLSASQMTHNHTYIWMDISVHARGPSSTIFLSHTPHKFSQHLRTVGPGAELCSPHDLDQRRVLQVSFLRVSSIPSLKLVHCCATAWWMDCWCYRANPHSRC